MKKSRLLYSTLLGLVLLFGCKKEDPEKIGPCGVKGPTTELPWLKEQIEWYSKYPNSAGFAIFSTVHKGNRYYWFFTPNGERMGEMVTCDGKSMSRPDIGAADEETKQFIELMRYYPGACAYLVWSSSEFKKSNCK